MKYIIFSLKNILKRRKSLNNFILHEEKKNLESEEVDSHLFLQYITSKDVNSPIIDLIVRFRHFPSGGISAASGRTLLSGKG